MSNMKKKEIAILSMQRVINFGSVLQAYSLREILRELTDAQVTFLDIEQEPALVSEKKIKASEDYAEPADYPPGILQKGKRWLITRLSAVNKQLIGTFMKKELKLTSEANQRKYDCVIIGSDEVFNHRNGVCLQLHGNVQQSEKIISYAASCGSARASDILPEDRKTVANALARIETISVRDRATAQYIEVLTGRAVVHHLDPVLMGNLCKRPHKPVFLKNYLLVYAYGQRIRTAAEIHAIQAFAKERSLKTVAIGGSQFWCDLYIPVPPMRMLDYFYYADCVVTDTFHGTIFSIINHKQFAVLPRKTNEAKITGLLEDLGLSDRLVLKLEDLEGILLNEISYDGVERILSEERIRAREYLKERLGVLC